jgi:hypothetical protein
LERRLDTLAARQRREEYAKRVDDVVRDWAPLLEQLALTKAQQDSLGVLKVTYDSMLGNGIASIAPQDDDKDIRSRLLTVVTRQLGAYRTLLTAEQRVTFDTKARAWIKLFAKGGHDLVIPGVRP